MKSVAIIGAGITGLTAAFYLKRKGVAVTVYEGSNRVGGVIQSIRGLKVIRTGVVAEPAVIKIEPPQATKRNTKDV